MLSVFTLSVSGHTTSCAHVPPVPVHAFTSVVVAISTIPAAVVLALPTVVQVSTVSH